MIQKQLNDSELIQSFLNGNVSDVEVLFKRHQDRLFTYIFFLVKNQTIAEDIFQDTFCKVYDSLRKGKYKDNGRFFSWMSRIAHNLVIDYFRDQKKIHTVSDAEQEEYIFNELSDHGEQRIVDKQMSSDIRAMLNLLPDEQREVVVMRNYLDMSFKEIANVSGVSINTALGRMRYAIINLRKIAQEKNITLEV